MRETRSSRRQAEADTVVREVSLRPSGSHRNKPRELVSRDVNVAAAPSEKKPGLKQVDADSKGKATCPQPLVVLEAACDKKSESL